MANETMRLQLPLLQPAQAQKHVTVNEALMRLDGLTNAVLESASVAVPPEAVIDGQSWGVPSGASGAWAGQGGRIAVGANGGWVFVVPSRGMLGAPMTYYNSATLLMTGEGGGFTGGKVRLAVHWMELRLPD